MKSLNPRVTSFVSGLIGVLVPIANQAFGWHLATGTVVTIVGALVALGAMEVGHGRNAAIAVNPLADIVTVLQQAPALVEEIAKRINRPVDPGIKASGDMARGVTVKDSTSTLQNSTLQKAQP